MNSVLPTVPALARHPFIRQTIFQKTHFLIQGVYSAYIRNEFQKQKNNVSGEERGRCVGLTASPEQ
jgi:hypothetical protein